MKQARITIILTVAILLSSCRPGTADNSDSKYEENADYIQVILIHLEQRCASCRAVENETLSLIEAEYSEEMKHGELTFISLSIQSENGREAARNLKASGQNLFVVRKDSISDLSGPAFLFASTHPERYRSMLKEELDKYLE